MKGGSRRLAHLDGFSLHADTMIPAHDGSRRQALVRYVLRPPFAASQISIDEDGNVRFRLAHPFDDGTTHVVWRKDAFLARLAALVPRPRRHLLTYHGVLGPAFLGDVDGDGRDDYAIGAVFASAAGIEAGLVDVRSGGAGNLLYTVLGGGFEYWRGRTDRLRRPWGPARAPPIPKPPAAVPRRVSWRVATARGRTTGCASRSRRTRVYAKAWDQTGGYGDNIGQYGLIVVRK